jgi:hypothetical protein
MRASSYERQTPHSKCPCKYALDAFPTCISLNLTPLPIQILPRMSAPTVWSTLWLIYSSDGVLSFVSGLGTRLLLGLVQNTIHELLSMRLARLLLPNSQAELEKKAQQGTVVAGAKGYVRSALEISLTALIMHPLDTALALASADAARAALGGARAYTGLFDCLQQLYNRHGLLGGLYGGLGLRLAHLNLQFGTGVLAERAAPKLARALLGPGRLGFYTQTTYSALLSAALAYPLQNALVTLRRNEVDVDEQQNGVHYASGWQALTSMVTYGGQV